jgi:hypothetical protein
LAAAGAFRVAGFRAMPIVTKKNALAAENALPRKEAEEGQDELLKAARPVEPSKGEIMAVRAFSIAHVYRPSGGPVAPIATPHSFCCNIFPSSAGIYFRLAANFPSFTPCGGVGILAH